MSTAPCSVPHKVVDTVTRGTSLIGGVILDLEFLFQIIEVGSVVEQSVEGVMEAGQQVVIATASEALAGVQTIEETYEQVTTDGTEQSTLVHANEASTALYYLTSFHSYES